MPSIKRVGGGVAAGLGALALAGVAAVLWMVLSTPARQDLPLPDGAIALESDEGQALLHEAATADHAALVGAFQSQEKGAWCGVAASVTVLNARGAALTQDGLFTPAASEVRSWLRTTFSGMPIADLAGLVEAHGATATVRYAEDASLDELRQTLTRNLATPGDWLVVNYDRRVVGESGGGHHSPVSAASPADAPTHVLILDTAAYKYGFHWVPVDRLFAAMDTPDSESGHSRGWVEIR